MKALVLVALLSLGCATNIPSDQRIEEHPECVENPEYAICTSDERGAWQIALFVAGTIILAILVE